MKFRLFALVVVLFALGCRRTSPIVITPVLTPSVVSTPLPSATPTPEAQVYVVEEGDTLWDIALEFGVTVEAIIAANGLEDPDSLAVGQRLLIPSSGNP